MVMPLGHQTDNCKDKVAFPTAQSHWVYECLQSVGWSDLIMAQQTKRHIH